MIRNVPSRLFNYRLRLGRISGAALSMLYQEGSITLEYVGGTDYPVAAERVTTLKDLGQ